ncbi:hypothetical protein ACFWY9_02095 [Amycolatopsis sp. NPDC059027]|uniref:hypothetical protein n=1 Tax=unclassified Amycolatopsis TaxID=2618356 RepID=UPI00366A9079
MADEFYLDEAAYDGIMTDLQNIGHRIGTSYKGLADVLLEFDGAWGSDDIGKAFEKKYLGEGPNDGARADVVALGGVEDNLDKSGDVGKKNARNFASVDRDTAKKMDLQ